MDANVVGPTAAETRTRRILIAGLCLGLLVVQADKVHAQQSTAHGEWRSYAGDKANTKYTPLAQIDRDNVSKLRVLWRRPALDPGLSEAFPDLNPSNTLQATPLMIGGVLYTSNSVGLVETLCRLPHAPLGERSRQTSPVGRGDDAIHAWATGAARRGRLVL